MKFDIAISIGRNCQSRYQISRTLYIRKHGTDSGFFLGNNRNTSNDFGTHFFDWSVTPVDGLIKILDSDFKGVFRIENLDVTNRNNGKAQVIDRLTGLKYLHDFPYGKQGTINSEELPFYYPRVKEKYDYLVGKTKRLLASNNNILFVLCGRARDVQLKEIIRLLEKKTSKFTILYLPWTNKNFREIGNDLQQHPRIIYRPIIKEAYPGNNICWEQAFSGIEIMQPK